MEQRAAGAGFPVPTIFGFLPPPGGRKEFRSAEKNRHPRIRETLDSGRDRR